MHPILRDIAGLSSGTIASLSGLTRYEEINRCVNRFYRWTYDQIRLDSDAFQSWQEAWEKFVESSLGFML